ncbi:MAG TPA: hypothetical protein VFU71_04050 [Burkholderiaceae bacterium]|nr:hypothetical protein [Burkholderiaceae bacterium]
MRATGRALTWRFALPLSAWVLCAQAGAAPPQLPSEGGLLVLPNVRVENSSQPIAGQRTRGQAGLKAYKDHETGKLRKATPEEQQEEAQSAPRANNPAGATIVVSPGGRKSATLDESFMSYSVVRKGADGKLDTMCVTGEAQARKALSGVLPAKEHGHAR